MNEKDGGAAFPLHAEHMMVQPTHNEGMTLRDYFAGQALPGLVVQAIDNSGTYDFYAAKAYLFADAMLKAREADSCQCPATDRTPCPYSFAVCVRRAAEFTIDRLRKEIDAANAVRFGNPPIPNEMTLAEAMAEQIRRRAEAEATLARVTPYLQHEPWCDYGKPCTCGLDAAKGVVHR